MIALCSANISYSVSVTNISSHTHTHTRVLTAMVKEYRAPFEDVTRPNPTIEEMRDLVVSRQERPAIPSAFQNNAVSCDFHMYINFLRSVCGLCM